MPSQAQYLELSGLVREALSWWTEHEANNGGSLGESIHKAVTWLRPWFRKMSPPAEADFPGWRRSHCSAAQLDR